MQNIAAASLAPATRRGGRWGVAFALLASCHSSTTNDATTAYGGDTGSHPLPDGSATRDDSGQSGAAVDAAGALDVTSNTAADDAAADAWDTSSTPTDAAVVDAADATSRDAGAVTASTSDATADTASTSDASADTASTSDATADTASTSDASADTASTSDALEEPNHVDSPELVFLLTYLGGIWGFTVNPVTGAPTPVPGSPFDRGIELYAMAVLPSHKFAYAVDSKVTGAVHSYRVDPDGSLHSIAGPLQLGALLSVTVDPKGQRLYVGDASHLEIEVFDIDQTTGALSARPSIQTGSSTFNMTASKDGAFLYFAQSQAGIRAFATPTTGDTSEVDGSPFGKDVAQLAGAMVAHPGGKFMYSGGTVLNGFEIKSDTGALQLLDQSPFSPHASADATAISVATDTGGRHLYCTDNVAHTLSAFAIHASGALEPLLSYDARPAPYSVAVDPSGRFVWVGEDNPDLVRVFSRDPATGLLESLPDIKVSATGLQPEVVFAP